MSVLGRTAALVPAAGRGERLGAGVPKALRLIGGTPMLVHAVHALAGSRSVDLVVIAAPEEAVERVRALFLEDLGAEILVVSGGDTRQASVARALIGLPDDVDVVLVHDAARPFVPSEVVSAVVAQVRSGRPAVIPALQVTDTIKQVDGLEMVVGTPDRAVLRAIQTPQGFDRAILQAAHAAADDDTATDDAGLVERQGVGVHVIPGHEEAFKVTRPIDLLLAESVLAKRRAGRAHG
ncbi:unannotated protein [freshwater metagenome]|uniref:2-C-methyl-D-erythritol 4-phosphate cytidylyltransferase n=1 Tax=freshwater metagenome TaxID=449393 RepID=A0A6J7HKQ0_9ZZZZ|nr:2-C-methyl-D-erythritol 4-phosphate cytidylyltransferase [Actinomycetota bacterium]MSY39051.1 2-C-methyl-D-erythritol 4-phosphate cytidylyltransferase [Actinomycetota bacterium]MSZ41138.1 2-C-methyl-D-erythritol 4-phosphate cytidylyltransferase [Actinomycetota bacterium]